jgi:large subunit ribosomal protein L13
MKIIDGTNAVMGRLASYAAKQALFGEEIIILNSEKVIITGSRQNILEKFRVKREKIGSGQKGPKHSRLSHLIVKRAIRGMLFHRSGRGKDAFRRIKCYVGVPEEFKDAKKIDMGRKNNTKSITVSEIKK